MKKRGSALVVVLLTLTALLITGLAVYSYIVNTSKTNNEEMKKEAIETAAMSALNIGEYYLINDKNYKNISSGSSKDIPNEYIQKKISDSNFNERNNINEENKLNFYNYNITLKNNGDKSYTISATAHKDNNNCIKQSKVIMKLENNLTKEERIQLFLNNSSGLTLLNTNNFNVSDNSFVILEDSTFNIKGVLKSNTVNADKQLDEFLPDDKINDSYVYNTKNINNGMKRVDGLNLKFGQRDATMYDLGQEIKWLEAESWVSKNNVILINNNGYEFARLSELNDDTLKNYSAAVIAIDSSYDNYVILCNGKLTLQGNLYISLLEGSGENQFFIYSTDSIQLDNAEINNRISLIAGNRITIDNYSNIKAYEQFTYSQSSIKNILEKFTK